jgi:NitT/TauT family transport system substrate-binding protein
MPLAAVMIFSAVGVRAAATRGPAHALTHVTFSVAVPVPDQGQVFDYVPQGAGFFKQNGLDVTLLTNAGGVAALKQVAAGNAQFGVGSPESLLNSLAGGEDLRGVAALMPHSAFSFGVLKSSPITKISQLRGKKVGVNSLGGGSYTIAEAGLLENGINPTTDARIVLVGTGGPALNALETGQVDAIVTVDTQWAIFQGLGGSTRLLPSPPIGAYPSDMLVVQTSYLDAHPKIVAAFGRAVMEGTVFAMANPQKAIGYFKQQYPEVARAVSSQSNLKILKVRLATMKLIPAQHGRYGYMPLYLYEKLQQVELKLNTVRAEQDLALVLTNRLISKMDAFSIGAIQKLAKGK